MKNALSILTEIIKQRNIELSFNIIEIGAVQLSENKEPFYQLLDYFPSSKIIGFELPMIFFTLFVVTLVINLS